MENIAHIKKSDDGNFEVQTLVDHFNGTAQLAAAFAAEFSNSDWGQILGLWHDLGKYSNEFQDYIKKNSGFEEDDQKVAKTDHTSAGAILAKELFPPPYWQTLAYCISGHHAGLLNYLPEIGISGDLSARLQKVRLLHGIKSIIPENLLNTCNLTPPAGKPIHPTQVHLWVRMLFSCLVDADFLDTEQFMNPVLHAQRRDHATFHDLNKLLSNHMTKLAAGAPPTKVNQIRQRVLADCLTAAKLPPGFFSLTVPTGGGKTLASIAWALQHATSFGKKRIIVGIPYTSIITQTARIYRDIFGNSNVLEHHSNLDDSLSTQERKLAAENWDVPIVITTNVQLFESLFSNRTSQCRKLHNLVNSVIILDEAQMLPVGFLKPVLSVLQSLVDLFGVSVLISTATQPVLTGRIGGTGKNSFDGIPKEKIREVCSDINELSKDLQRVELNMPDELNQSVDWQEIANELIRFEQVLCVVNTRKQCRTLFELMPPGTIHLSRMMCSAHLTETIDLIKQKLAENQPVRIISTQLIEAGVDIDFPVVYRALAGMDSIAQCAGRCNREGKLNANGRLGYTKVFIPPQGAPPGLLRKGADTTKEMIAVSKDQNINWLSPESYTAYFHNLFSKADQFDQGDIEGTLWNDAHQMKFQFATAARDFKLIDDKGARSIIVGFKEGNDLIQLLKRKGPAPWLMRKLQRFTVSVSERDFLDLMKYRMIEDLHGCCIQADPHLYDHTRGLVLNNEWIEEIFIL